ncbi:hypothetical protein DFH09DRAFT_1098056 [Mycena vulgaris]|nr:hypothetical protein DFH09DRAFT_1098056 [Mycena vulgaris]
MSGKAPDIFEEAANITPKEIKAYRKFAGFHILDATTKVLKAYRSYMMAERFMGLSFFSLDNTEVWISPIAFQAYTASINSAFDQYHSKDSTPFSSRAPSRAASSISYTPSRASSPVSFAPSSRCSSPVSFPASDFGSRPPSAMSVDAPIFTTNSHDPGYDEQCLPQPIPRSVQSLSAERQLVLNPPPERPLSPRPSTEVKAKSKAKKSKPPGKAKDFAIQITREEAVDEIIDSATIPSTWSIPRSNVVIRLDMTNLDHILRTSSGKIQKP